MSACPDGQAKRHQPLETGKDHWNRWAQGRLKAKEKLKKEARINRLNGRASTRCPESTKLPKCFVLLAGVLHKIGDCFGALV